MKIPVKIMLWILGTAAVFVVSISILGWMFSKPGYEGPKSDHFNGAAFQNISEVPAKNLFDVMKWYLNRDQGPWEEIPESEVVFAQKPAAKVTDALVITYVNHSTFLIQADGLNILTDPVWSDRVSPLSFAGPKRMRSPGVKFEDLPKIDLVVISHNHYDHLDISTLKKLNARFQPHFVVPLGVDVFLQQEGLSQTTALDWWDGEGISNGLKVNLVPAQHFSARGLFDRDKTLWGGYVLQTSFGNLYFAGDTGYGDFFPEIGKRFKPIKIGLIPIGAYKPRWFMSPVHVNPAEAIQIHKDIGAEISFGMHFGTFPLADDGMNEPERDFAKAIQRPENRGENFKLLTEGDSFVLKD
jgi:L-ascorbate metabolism protein UlaG (beta-lactamase superfamily)